MNDRRLPFPLLLICSLLLLGGCIVIGISFGRYTIPPGDVVRTLLPWFFRGGVADPNVAGVIWGIRLPRLLGAMAVGAGLALSGASYQGIFQNPLVSPDLLGVSSGACVGAATAILLVPVCRNLEIINTISNLALVLCSLASKQLTAKHIFLPDLPPDKC